jgi:predicted TIM-barrel fold metal-dependent hydrolase
MFIRENLRAIEALGLPAEDLRKVLFGNAAAMMRLPG